jgi:VIT1/CCC1 family predicted Fe2+/Mn2+ transporter
MQIGSFLGLKLVEIGSPRLVSDKVRKSLISMSISKMGIMKLLKFCRGKDIAITNYIFGGTSAIVTSLAIITGLNASENPRLAIIGSLLVIALADNISDSLGIHIYQESEGMAAGKVWLKTCTNFFTRLIVSFGFIAIIVFFPLPLATYIAIAYGLATLAIFSYFIAISQNRKPAFPILEHLCIAIVVIAVSKFVGDSIITAF